MSVSSQETVFHHVGNGITVTFAYACQVPLASDLSVYVNDVLTTSGFTVAGIGSYSGGSITFAVPPAAGVAIRIEREIELERTTDYQQNGDFLSRVVNPDFDRLWMALQQQVSGITRAIKVPKSDGATPWDLPSSAERANKLLSFDDNGNPISIAAAAQSATALGLLLGSWEGPANIGYSAISEAVSGTLGMHFKGDVNPADYPWLCKFDGVTDDTAGWWACVAFAMEKGYKIRHPGGVLRVTSGYTTVAAYRNLFITGAGRANEAASAVTSVILLDSATPGSYFFKTDHNLTVCCEGLTFKCAQYVAERPFFKFAAGLHCEFFTRCGFEAVERPIVWAAGTYFQNAAFRDIQFRNSGTFHSECPDVAGQLIGTYLLLDNINHEGSVPVNAEKIICNLRGIRQLEIGQFVNEGSLPSAGWTGLLLANPYDTYYTRQSLGSCVNYHSEWSGAFQPAYCVDQKGGTFKFDYIVGLYVTSKYKLSSNGKAIIESSAFTENATDEATSMFELEDNTCIVQLDSCSARTIDLTKAGFVQKNMQWASVNNGTGQVVVSSDAAQEIWRWNGGILDGDQALYQLFGGTTSVYSTDAAYGRKLVLTPNAGALDARITLKTGSMLVPGDQLVMCVRAKLPTFAAGLWGFTIVSGGATISTKYFDSTSSGAYVDVLMPIVLLTTPATIAFGFTNGTTVGVATTLEILSMAMYHGNSVPRRQVPCYPENTVSWSSAAPTTGTWKRGDIVWNDAPSAAGIPGWVCIATGTPGTWKAMAVLAA